MSFVLNQKRKTLLPVLLLLCAMISIQSGASLVKSLFPTIGALGVTALRLFLATIILFIIFKLWQKKLRGHSLKHLLIYGISLDSMNSLSLLLNSKINYDLQKNQPMMIKSSIFALKITYVRLKNKLFLHFLDVSNLFLF